MIVKKTINASVARNKSITPNTSAFLPFIPASCIDGIPIKRSDDETKETGSWFPQGNKKMSVFWKSLRDFQNTLKINSRLLQL
jgi:hypothetical protein